MGLVIPASAQITRQMRDAGIPLQYRAAYGALLCFDGGPDRLEPAPLPGRGSRFAYEAHGLWVRAPAGDDAPWPAIADPNDARLALQVWLGLVYPRAVGARGAGRGEQIDNAPGHWWQTVAKGRIEYRPDGDSPIRTSVEFEAAATDAEVLAARAALVAVNAAMNVARGRRPGGGTYPTAEAFRDVLVKDIGELVRRNTRISRWALAGGMGLSERRFGQLCDQFGVDWRAVAREHGGRLARA